MLSKLLKEDKNFDVKNVKKYMMLYYNKKVFVNILCGFR